mmetsp:Transcript_25990/g.58750  ORF Transcript_25990/g.58750 Transcript_25990/m.58750 type:complete len:318 (+) Transcript_25990:1188-2141(+)
MQWLREGKGFDERPDQCDLGRSCSPSPCIEPAAPLSRCLPCFIDDPYGLSEVLGDVKEGDERADRFSGGELADPRDDDAHDDEEKLGGAGPCILTSSSHVHPVLQPLQGSLSVVGLLQPQDHPPVAHRRLPPGHSCALQLEPVRHAGAAGLGPPRRVPVLVVLLSVEVRVGGVNVTAQVHSPQVGDGGEEVLPHAAVAHEEKLRPLQRPARRVGTYVHPLPLHRDGRLVAESLAVASGLGGLEVVLLVRHLGMQGCEPAAVGEPPHLPGGIEPELLAGLQVRQGKLNPRLVARSRDPLAPEPVGHDVQPSSLGVGCR